MEKICVGCGHVLGDEIQAPALACCPDSSYCYVCPDCECVLIEEKVHGSSGLVWCPNCDFIEVIEW